MQDFLAFMTSHDTAAQKALGLDTSPSTKPGSMKKKPSLSVKAGALGAFYRILTPLGAVPCTRMALAARCDRPLPLQHARARTCVRPTPDTLYSPQLASLSEASRLIARQAAERPTRSMANPRSAQCPLRSTGQKS